MPKKDLLNKHRVKIDSIDKKILALLNQRAKEAKTIGKIKARNNEEIFVFDRERKVIEGLLRSNRGPLREDDIEDIFGSVLAACRSLQKRITVAYLGPEATFTHQAAIKHFGRGAELAPVPSIRDVFSEVERKRADFGLVPIENSTEGVVNHTLDMFLDSDLCIIAERQEKISHNLLSLSGDKAKIRTVFSHPQALAQCRNWIEAHLSGVSVQESSSTADAAVQATLDKNAAAIASEPAAQMYDLKCVALGIEDSPDNATRFLVIGREGPEKSGQDKTSILMAIKDRVGALHDVLNIFKKEKLNLTKIESRPTKKKAWEYVFFIDFIGHQKDPSVRRVLAKLKPHVASLKILGSYPYRA